MTQKDKIQYVKYAIALAALISSYFNFVEYMSRGTGLYDLFVYSGTLFIISVLLIVIPGRYILIIVFIFAGLMMLFDSPDPKQITAGTLMFVCANLLVEGLFPRVAIYSLLIWGVIYKHIVHGFTTTSVMNNLVAYISFFVVFEIMYNRDRDKSL